MIGTIICLVLIVGYVTFTITHSIMKIKKAKKEGLPISCCSCSSSNKCKSNNCSCSSNKSTK